MLFFFWETRPDSGVNSGGGGKNLGEVQRSSSRPPWKVRERAKVNDVTYACSVHYMNQCINEL
jgi:hypothetical protein